MRRVGRDPAKVVAAKRRYAESARGMFTMQRKAAAQRGVAWELTFEQWLEIWGDKLPLRGRTGLVMARNGDTGPYAAGNVRIATAADNLAERQMPRGENHQYARLTAGCVERVRDMLACGVPHQAIGDYFGVARTMIGRIARLETRQEAA